ncbi:MAG: glycosyltransferase family 4 protein, partial [Solirubrobacterales bacterium]|nr:glycosyltransferase family 4 protein [Solirubrobacterales bacterium]
MTMRFALATTFYPPWSFGGDGIQVQRLARALAARGHEVTVVHSREGYTALGGDEHPPADRDGDVRLVAIDAGRVSPTVTYLTGRPLLARPQLAAALADDFDVVHFHNPSLLGGPAALALGDGIKLYTAHEQWLVCPMHVLWQDRRRVCEQPHCVRCSLRHRRPPQPWRATGLLARSVRELDALIVPSATSARLHARFAGDVRIEELPHFVEDPGETAPPSDHPRPYVLFAGRLADIKGPATLPDAFRELPGVDLLIAGTGELEPEIRARAAGLPNVRLLGWVDAGGLDALYRGALAAVVPSVGHESFGLVPVEAFARGTPALVRDFGALAEFVALAPCAIGYRTTSELTEAVAELAREPRRRQELGAVARRTYLERFR